MPENIEPKYKVKVPKLNAVKKKFDFSLSLSGMISIVGVGLLALTFFFVMGILIGRGYRPESDVKALNDYMPRASEHGQEAKVEPPKVLTPEELDYQERLKAPQVMDTPAQEPAKAKQATKPVEVKPEPKAEPVKVAKPEHVAPAKAETVTAKSGEKVYDYVYQVASFRKRDMAETLKDKLAASGLNADIASGEAKGSTWHRVQVKHHGTPASTNDMKAVLAKFGIKKPLLKKKKLSQ